ncbi:MAG TPA: hypothetical protein VFH92_13145 [Phenylobacterium sp.]|nr:hypothetical protein [Phenylobacterium sp.]
MRLRGYELGDEFRVPARADFARDFEAAGRTLPAGPKLTLVDDAGAVAGVAGFMNVGPRQWCAWAFLADLAPRQWARAGRLARTCARWATALLDDGCDVYATPYDTDQARRLLAAVGFRPSPDDAGVWKFMEPRK